MRTMSRKKARWLRPAALLLSLLTLAAFAVPREAAAQFAPYYGKNKVKYDNFAWRIYKSPHFEVFYYPEFEQHLGRLTSYLESSYLKISTALKHEMPQPIPVIFYKTHSEFEQTNLFPAFIPEGVAAFTEPVKNRMVLPIDEPPDQLQGLITHEMVHAFAFDLIPRGIGFGISQSPIPLWVDEGLADYLRGIWEPLDLMMVRVREQLKSQALDLVLTDTAKKLLAEAAPEETKTILGWLCDFRRLLVALPGFFVYKGHDVDEAVGSAHPVGDVFGFGFGFVNRGDELLYRRLHNPQRPLFDAVLSH